MSHLETPLSRFLSLLNIIFVSCCKNLRSLNQLLKPSRVCFLGIPGELFYVRHGFVNEYALSFSIPIKSDVTDIYFVWQSLHESPPQPLVRLLS